MPRVNTMILLNGLLICVVCRPLVKSHYYCRLVVILLLLYKRYTLNVIVCLFVFLFICLHWLILFLLWTTCAVILWSLRLTMTIKAVLSYLVTSSRITHLPKTPTTTAWNNNTTLYDTFVYFSKERDYLVILRTYSCTTSGVLKCKVLEHYSDICAAREVTDWSFELLPTWRINVFIIQVAAVLTA